MKYFEENKGITLIALVITIIVLLILAGVTIAILTGENGILNRATESKEINKEAGVLEEVKLGYGTCRIDNNYSKENFQKNVSGTIEYWNYRENEKKLLIYRSIEGIEYYICLENGEISFYDENINKLEGTENEEWKYEEQEDGSIMITGYLGTNPEPVMPDIINNKPVTKIGNTALKNSEFTGIFLSKFLEEIGNSAFGACINLKKVELPDGIKIVGETAFGNCKALEEIRLPKSLTMTGYRAFGDLGNITMIYYNVMDNTNFGLQTFNAIGGNEEEVTLIIGPDVKNIAQRTFQKTNISKIECVGDNIYSIQDYAFWDCKRLETIDLGENQFKNLKRLGESAFAGLECKKIIVGRNLDLEGLGFTVFAGNTKCEIIEWNNTSIDAPKIRLDRVRTFRGIGTKTENGTTAIFGEDVTKIPDGIFGDDDASKLNNVTKVILKGKVDEVGNLAFRNTFNLSDVYITDLESWNEIKIGSYNTYFENATKWFYSESQPIQEGNYWHYDEQGNVVEWS